MIHGALKRLAHLGTQYVNPQPGFFFANTDLAGANDHRNSIREADRAVKQII